jgi:hypothetical protein
MSFGTPARWLPFHLTRLGVTGRARARLDAPGARASQARHSRAIRRFLLLSLDGPLLKCDAAGGG